MRTVFAKVLYQHRGGRRIYGKCMEEEEEGDESMGNVWKRRETNLWEMYGREEDESMGNVWKRRETNLW